MPLAKIESIISIIDFLTVDKSINMPYWQKLFLIQPIRTKST